MTFTLIHGLGGLSPTNNLEKQAATLCSQLTFGRLTFLALLFAALTTTQVTAQEASCKASCDQRIGGTDTHIEESWSSIRFFTKGIFSEDYDSDKLSTYHPGNGNVKFVSETKDGLGNFGVGVAGPSGVLPHIRSQINYVAEKDRSDKLLIDFGCEFTGAEVMLSRFYSGENGDMGETGGWRAFDENFNLIAIGAFAANVPYRPYDPGLFMFKVRVSKPFRYLELVARPYIDRSKSTFADNSDYFLQSVTPTCQDIVESENRLGNGESFGSWNQAAITFRAADEEVFFPADENNFSINDADNNGGLGVPNDDNMQLNYCADDNSTEEIQIDLGANFTTFELTLTDLFEGEEGFWIAYDYDDNFNLVEVGRGSFVGTDNQNEKALSKSGTTTTTARTTDTGGFRVITLGGGPLGGGKSSRKNVCGQTGFFINRLVPDPVCLGATEVVSYNPGPNRVGGDIPVERTNTANALLEPDDLDVDAPVNFVSLGFGGEITLKFFEPFKNGKGPDVQVFETSVEEDGNCATHPELAEVFASQDGENFVFLGVACRDDALFDLGPLSWAQYIKLIDISNPDDFEKFGRFSDGYDVDAVVCLNGRAESTPFDGLIPCTAQDVIEYQPGTRKDGNTITSSRTMAENVLGDPDSFDTPSNLTALGFGDGRRKGENATSGFIVVRFDFVIFDEKGDEVTIFESTSWDPIYGRFPETAEVYASKDGEDWTFLGTTNTDCPEKIDSDIDFDGAIRWAQYIKLVDITYKFATRTDKQCNPTNESAFNRASDGYDVDAITCAGYEVSTKSVQPIIEDVDGQQLTGYPNPMETTYKIDLSDQEEFVSPDGSVMNITIYDFMGVKVGAFEAEINESFEMDLDMTGFKPGVYFLRIQGEDKSDSKTLRVVKK